MTSPYALPFAVLLIAALLAAGCTGTAGPGTPTLPPTTPPPTTAAPANTPSVSPATITDLPGLVAFVEDAAAFARANGREDAVRAFNDPDGAFVSANVHLFAVDYEGTLLADAAEPGIVGTEIGNMTDSFGVPFVRNLAETARLGRGIVSYTYPDPARNLTAEPRVAVVEDVDGAYFVAAGIFVPEDGGGPTVLPDPSAEKPGVDELVAHVESAVAYARANGKENALAEFANPNGSFAGGTFGLTAYDSDGTALAGPPESSELSADGLNLINYHDRDGVAVVRGMRDVAARGGGVYHAVAKVHVDGRALFVPEIDYAAPVDGTWWIASGLVMPEYAGTQVRNHTREELYDLVNRAVDFAKTNGKEAALAEIDNPAGRFVNDDLFVWAESSDGTVLADPFWKAGVGTDQRDSVDRYGMKITQVGLDAMNNGTGFYHALFPNTAANGTADVPKLIYMKAVDDAWWIGSGVYGLELP